MSLFMSARTNRQKNHALCDLGGVRTRTKIQRWVRLCTLYINKSSHHKTSPASQRMRMVRNTRRWFFLKTRTFPTYQSLLVLILQQNSEWFEFNEKCIGFRQPVGTHVAPVAYYIACSSNADSKTSAFYTINSSSHFYVHKSGRVDFLHSLSFSSKKWVCVCRIGLVAFAFCLKI